MFVERPVAGENKFGGVVWVEGGVEYPVSCACGIDFLCERHMRQLLSGEKPASEDVRSPRQSER